MYRQIQKSNVGDGDVGMGEGYVEVNNSANGDVEVSGGNVKVADDYIELIYVGAEVGYGDINVSVVDMKGNNG